MRDELNTAVESGGEGVFSTLADKDSVYGNPIEAVPTPPKNIGIDTNNTLFDDIIYSGESSQLDLTKLNSFLTVSRNRNDIYNVYDTMSEDSRVASVLSTYAEDATEYNDQGKIVWVESSDENVSKFVSFLLDTLNVDKNIYSWTYSLCKYGDLYLRLYRQSEIKDPIFDKKAKDADTSDTLNEDVKIKAFSKNDNYAHYVKAVDNPAEMFELVKFGKTYGFIEADTGLSEIKKDDRSLQSQYYQYRFGKKDIKVYDATEFVHACLEENVSRFNEKVSIFVDDNTVEKSDNPEAYTYTVKRGQSILYDAFKAWRELTLMEGSVLLNRITKSSIIRVIGVEVADMPKEQVGPHMQGVKNLIEQKMAINVGNSMSEYTNPGPIENNIYVPVRNGQGAITPQTIGGDVDVKSLADLDSFKTKFYSAFKVPKAFFGETDDGAGFNGGTSLSIISSRYAKSVKRIQNAMVQAITDLINLLLIDKGLKSYINKFQIRMLPPATQEEISRREETANRMSVVQDVMSNASDIGNPIARLKILKSLLANAITNTEVTTVIQEEIDRLESEQDSAEMETEESEFTDGREVSADIDNLGDDDASDGDNESSREEEEETIIPLTAKDTQMETNLPTPNELGQDFTDNSNF